MIDSYVMHGGTQLWLSLLLYVCVCEGDATKVRGRAWDVWW